uniref:Tc1-like transposase DDE domain-containing protein n=1 Tax=Octopus bimaculoides TaxID=37653 RepID=A0A0L8GYF7_OCTBM
MGKTCNVTFAVLGESGLVHHTIANKTVRACANMFSADESVYLIYDNMQPHVCTKLPADADPRISMKLLPSYLPFLNCTEKVHSAFKTAVKRDLARTELQQWFGDWAAAEKPK